jgi:hypothetical protein
MPEPTETHTTPPGAPSAPAAARRFVGIDLGGARGKTTAVARLTADPAGQVVVEDVSRRHRGRAFHDAVILDYLDEHGAGAVVAVNAPLTAPACVRCRLAVCPGAAACVDPAVVWLRSEGIALAVARSEVVGVAAEPPTEPPAGGSPTPYLHRCTELLLHRRGAIPRDAMGKANGPLAGRAGHLRRRLAERGFVLHRDLIEVAPQALVRARLGGRLARGYKRDADPWQTRATILEALADLRFARSSRFAREEALQSDHCFEALLAAYAAHLRAREGWPAPPDELAEDGWIFAPP